MARRLRSGFGLDSRTPCRWHRSFTVPLLFAVVVARADGGSDPSQVKDRVQALHDRVVELAGEDDLLDTLYFGWSDRPYARATLAILVKVAATLDREVDCRGHGNSKIDDATVESMLGWADDAIQRVIHAEPSPDFRPDRMKMTWSAVIEGTEAPPLFAFVDGARSLRTHPVFGDLDLLAALGQRLYARPSGERFPEEDLEVTARRAEAVGQAVVDWSILGPKDAQRCGVAEPDRRTRWPGRPQYVAVGTLAWLTRDREPTTGNDPTLPAVGDPVGGELLPASLARRATLRGAINRFTYGVTHWTLPVADASPEHRRTAWRAAMWMQVLDGQRLALIETWRDVSPDAGDRSGPSVFIDPAEAETIAHTALDMQRLAKFVAGFETRPTIAFVVGPEAACSAAESGCPPGQSDTWASWVQPIWKALVARQVSFDVVSDRTDEKALHGRYRAVFPLRREACVDPSDAIGRIERRLAQDSEHVYRLTAREMDGTIARDMFVRVGRTPEGKACAGIVNLSDRSRVLKLRGKPAIGASRDVISNQEISEPGQRLKFEPWQVRLLWPTD